MNWKERRYCGQITESDINQSITLYGWVDAIRDHGHLLFIHLRDISGIIQLVFDPEKDPISYEKAQKLRSEYVVEINGIVAERSEETKNDHIKTGKIEIIVKECQLLNEAKTPPFVLTEKSHFEEDESPVEFNVDEDLRLKYRFLDLRRPSMQDKLIKRSQYNQLIRQHLSENGFLEIETPVLTKSTPEGARDYLVPSRTHENKFFALPQSPQLFKQLTMVSGLDKYFQIVRCFRDEDLRPNRQPEFTQVDLEASFIDEDYIYQLIETLLKKLFSTQNITLPETFPKMTYDDAISKYGNDHPDLRFGMELVDVTDCLTGVSYKIFETIISKGGLIKGFAVKNQADALSKNVMQNEIAMKLVPQMGAKGMTWMKVINGKLESNIVQFFTDDHQAALINALGAEDGDVLCFIADTNHKLVSDVLGRLRLHMAERLNLIPKDVYKPVWITDFPLFEKADGGLTSPHHPFTAPSEDILNVTDQEQLLNIKAKAYDIVINGEEVGGGSIRIHDQAIQQRIFELLGLSQDEIKEKFGFFVNALDYGTPPHGGLALGADRLYAMLLQTDSIRDIIAFPKNRTAHCPLTGAPDHVQDKQLEELKIKIIPNLS